MSTSHVTNSIWISGYKLLWVTVIICRMATDSASPQRRLGLCTSLRKMASNLPGLKHCTPPRNERRQNAVPLIQLPTDLILYIAQFLAMRDAVALTQACSLSISLPFVPDFHSLGLSSAQVVFCYASLLVNSSERK